MIHRPVGCCCFTALQGVRATFCYLRLRLLSIVHISFITMFISSAIEAFCICRSCLQQIHLNSLRSTNPLTHFVSTLTTMDSKSSHILHHVILQSSFGIATIFFISMRVVLVVLLFMWERQRNPCVRSWLAATSVTAPSSCCLRRRVHIMLRVIEYSNHTFAPSFLTLALVFVRRVNSSSTWHHH